MANTNESESMFKNENTRARRAWIESAIASVRAHLEVSTFSAPPVDALGHESVEAPPEATGVDITARPRLYVAWSDGQRCSGI